MHLEVFDREEQKDKDSHHGGQNLTFNLHLRKYVSETHRAKDTGYIISDGDSSFILLQSNVIEVHGQLNYSTFTQSKMP